VSSGKNIRLKAEQCYAVPVTAISAPYIFTKFRTTLTPKYPVRENKNMYAYTSGF